jgi:hypothetical protein
MPRFYSEYVNVLLPLLAKYSASGQTGKATLADFLLLSDAYASGGKTDEWKSLSFWKLIPNLSLWVQLCWAFMSQNKVLSPYS